MMEQVRWSDMKKKRFINVAWQMYVDAILKKGPEYVTSELPANAGRSSAVQHGGNLGDAIRSQMPGLNEEGIAAEEVVDCILRIEIIEHRIPVEVCCPAHHAAWHSHAEVVCRKKQM